MANPLLSNFELAGQQIDIRDSASYELANAAQQAATTAEDTASAAQQAATTAEATANAAQQAATTAEATASAAQQAATTAEATASAAQQAADGIIAGFNTQFEQKSGAYVSPFFCLRNKTAYVEFPNININKLIPADSWTVVCNIREIHLPLSTVYRTVTIGGVKVIVELNKNGQMKMYSQTEIPINTPIFGGFSYLTI